MIHPLKPIICKDLCLSLLTVVEEKLLATSHCFARENRETTSGIVAEETAAGRVVHQINHWQ
jgi:hypothetical protein